MNGEPPVDFTMSELLLSQSSPEYMLLGGIDSSGRKRLPKVKIACENCRLRKKKCDGVKPMCLLCKSDYDKKVVAQFKSKKGFAELPDCRYREDVDSLSEDKVDKKVSKSLNGIVKNGGKSLSKNSSLATLLDRIDLLKEQLKDETISRKSKGLVDEIQAGLKGLRQKDAPSDRSQEAKSEKNNAARGGECLGGCWDRSVESILRWPIFEGKHDNVQDIKIVIQKDDRHVLLNMNDYSQSFDNFPPGTNEKSCLDSDSSVNTEITPNFKRFQYVKLEDLPHLAFCNFQKMTSLEPLIMQHLSARVEWFIENVHTSGNLFMDVAQLRKSVECLEKAYTKFLTDHDLPRDSSKTPEYNKESFLLHYKSGDNLVPVYILLMVVATSLVASRYDPKNPLIARYKSSLAARNSIKDFNLAFEYYKLSKQFKHISNANIILPNKEVVENKKREYYSLWDVQYNVLLSLYKNYMLKPMEAWKHISTASLLIILYLEMHQGNLPDEPQLIQRVFWLCYKNEAELKMYLSPMYSTSGIISYKPPFKIGDLRLPSDINSEGQEVKDGWAFYLTDVFVRPIVNKSLNTFFCQPVQPKASIESSWQNFSQQYLVESIQKFLKETGDLLKIFETFLSQQRLSTPLRCADERVVRIKETLSLPLLYHITTFIPLPIANYTVAQQEARPIRYEDYIDSYLLSFLKDLCGLFVKTPDFMEFASERRHGSWYRLRDIYLCVVILMIIYKQFGIYFFAKAKLQNLVETVNKIYPYWILECNELSQALQVINETYRSLPYIET